MLQNKIITSCLLLLIAVGGFFGNIESKNTASGNVAYAAESDCPGKWDSEFWCPGDYDKAVGKNTGTSWINSPETKCEWINCVAKTVNSIFKIMTIIVSPAIIFASWLLSPDWTSGDMFNLRGTMYNMWVMISNIIYFIYAILLIIIALGTIFWNEKFGYKAMLPRLALGIIMVPFTWWFVQWTISLATVVTASVITIPMETVANNKDNSFLDKILIPSEITITNIDKFEEQATTQSSCSKPDSTCIKLMDFINNWGGAYGSLLAYAYGVFQINEVTTVNGILDTAKTIWELVNGVIIWVLMFIVFGILVLALIFVLMMRAIKLWMYAIFSPLFTVHFVLGKDMLGEKMWDFNLKEFVWLCFVPAVVWLVLSFGLIIISGVMWAKSATTSSDSNKITMFGIPGNYIETKVQSKDSNSYTETKVAFGWVTMNFQGKAYSTKTSWDNQTNWTAVAKDTLTAIGGIFGTIVIDIIALIFIWAAFMAAKWTSKAVAGAIKPFEDMGNKIWELWASLPKYTPLPIPGGSVSGMNKTLELWKQKFDSKMREKEEEQIGSLFPWLVQWIIQEKTRMEAQGKMKDKESTLKESWELLQWAKDNSTNASKLRMTQEQAHQMEYLKQHIQSDSAVQSDEKLKKAFEKYLAGKTGEMNEYEIKSVFDYFRKYGSWGNKNNATNSQSYTAKEIIGKKDRMEVNIGDIRFDAKIDGTDIQWISDDEKKKLWEIMKEVTEDKFKERFSGLDSKTVNAIIEELKKDWRKFKDK
jgi:hypothetical protein